LTLYAAELLHLLHHIGHASPVPPFRLRDDAAKAITQIAAPASKPAWTFELNSEERDTLASDFIGTLIDLNLTLPPDPEAKHEPTTLSAETDDQILLGNIEREIQSASSSVQKGTSRSSRIVPREVTRLLNQSVECLRWNAALALYALGLDLVETCEDGLQRSLVKWRRRAEQAKIMVCNDILLKAARARKASNPPL